jgi:hypothetical protein
MKCRIGHRFFNFTLITSVLDLLCVCTYFLLLKPLLSTAPIMCGCMDICSLAFEF